MRLHGTAAMTSMQPEAIVLAFDYGTRRVGVAIANTVTATARPLLTIHSQGQKRWSELTKLIDAWAPKQLIVGVPRHPDGAAHEMTQQAERFARQLAGRYRLPVARVDERYSTTAVAGAQDVDAAAAAVILQQWLDSEAQ